MLKYVRPLTSDVKKPKYPIIALDMTKTGIQSLQALERIVESCKFILSLPIPADNKQGKDISKERGLCFIQIYYPGDEEEREYGLVYGQLYSSTENPENRRLDGSANCLRVYFVQKEIDKLRKMKRTKIEEIINMKAQSMFCDPLKVRRIPYFV
jgi:hypothetical protein